MPGHDATNSQGNASRTYERCCGCRQYSSHGLHSVQLELRHRGRCGRWPFVADSRRSRTSDVARLYLPESVAVGLLSERPQSDNAPLRRAADGTFEEISWATAIAEIAAKAQSIRAAHGGDAFAYYGGGGQGNHLGGAHSTSLRVALGTRYVYTALAQEDGRLLGRRETFRRSGLPPD